MTRFPDPADEASLAGRSAQARTWTTRAGRTRAALTRAARLAPACLALAFAVPCARADDAGAQSLFDGRSLAGWRASENAGSFKVVDGAIACDGPRSHLFYVGADGSAAFENFEAEAEVLTRPGANSGFYFHTAFQAEGWPSRGFEVQVNNSQARHGDYLELKMTGSLYGVRNVYKALARDDRWFRLNVTVRRPRVEVRVDGVLVVDWTEPVPTGREGENRLGRGTFALQCHDPGSKVFYRNLRVRPLPSESAEAAPRALDPIEPKVLALGRANFPLVDLHAHLKGGLTLEQALALSRRSGVFLGVAVNCGKGFPIETDAQALAWLESMKGAPAFLAMQAEGREWVDMFSPETRARFDYVFTDAMTWSNPAGRRMRLWMPEEVEIGPDEQAFMDLLVAKTVGILEREPIDVWVNPSFLPAAIAPRYDALWTEPRMSRVIDAAVEHGVAIEINARYRIPSERFLRLAKAKGAKFTFGTNNAGAADLGDWSYPLEMQERLGLEWRDMFVPGHEPNRAQRDAGQTGPPADSERARSRPNTLTDAERAAGWRLLWDGETPRGWRSARGRDFPKQGWEIEDGVLSVEETGGEEARAGGDIVSEESFSAFELALEFRLTRGANSGVKYYVDTGLNKAQGSAIGLEYQLLDDASHPDAKQGRDGNRTLASLYDLIPAAASKPARPIGEWNEARVVSDGRHVEHWLNGVKVLEYERGSDAFRKLVAGSKYKVWPAFGELASGPILLQDHGNRVSFRNVRIRETKPR